MDLNYVDEEEEAAAMAAMMGFSGFGSQKLPAKKRKFTTDAFVDGQEPELDKGGKKGQGSGGNTMPLGKTRVFGTGSTNKAIQSVAVNDSEIDLGDEEDLDGPQYIDTSLPPPILATEDEGPYRSHFEPPPGVSEEEAKEMQSRIDDILASVESRGTESVPTPDPQRPHGLPQWPNLNPPYIMNDSNLMRGGLRPSFDANNPRDAFSDSVSVASSRPSHRGGPRNDNWYLDHYDPSFNVNPWAKLEREKGLEPLGKWPESQGATKLK